MFDFDRNSPESILAYAKKLEGLTFLDEARCLKAFDVLLEEDHPRAVLFVRIYSNVSQTETLYSNPRGCVYYFVLLNMCVHMCIYRYTHKYSQSDTQHVVNKYL